MLYSTLRRVVAPLAFFVLAVNPLTLPDLNGQLVGGDLKPDTDYNLWALMVADDAQTVQPISLVEVNIDADRTVLQLQVSGTTQQPFRTVATQDPRDGGVTTWMLYWQGIPNVFGDDLSNDLALASFRFLTPPADDGSDTQPLSRIVLAPVADDHADLVIQKYGPAQLFRLDNTVKSIILAHDGTEPWGLCDILILNGTSTDLCQTIRLLITLPHPAT